MTRHLQETRPKTAFDDRFSLGPLLHQDEFTYPDMTRNWQAELEADGTVEAKAKRLILDVPKGCTLWFRTELTGPVLIEYFATAIRRGGANDRVSDLNCFWMAQDPQHPGKLLEVRRSGAFADYDTLLAYYVGLGGNANTTTRFRRYIGKAGDRPLLPRNDLRAPEYLLKPNVRQRIRLVACNSLIQYYRDDRKLFEIEDPEPYTRGWFGFRTVASHFHIEQFRVYRLHPSGK